MGNERFAAPIAERRLENEVVEQSENELERTRIAAPVRFDRIELQIFAEQMAAQHRQVRLQGRRFRDHRSKRVGERYVSGRSSRHETRDALQRVLAQEQRIAPGVGHATKKHVDLAQARERFQVNDLVAHREIAPLDELVAEVARHVGVLERALVARTGREQENARLMAVALRSEVFDHAPHLGEERGDTLDVVVAEQIGQRAPHDEAIFERVARARRAPACGRSQVENRPEASRPMSTA